MDNTVLEYTAEDLIAHKLQRHRILIAKPKFDQEGADLLAFLGVTDGAKFVRIQCKGRTLDRATTSQVTVRKEYVTDGFVLFLFIETGDKEQTMLFCFLGSEIRRSWRSTPDDDYYALTLSKNSLENNLSQYRFTDARIRDIKKAIIHVDVEGEFRKVIHGYIEQTLPSVTQAATGTVGSSESNGE